MHSIKKILPRAAAVLCFVFLLESAVQFLYQPYDKYSIYANREYREQKGGVDTLFCGTSHVYYAFDPALFDKRLGTNSFNMGNRRSAHVQYVFSDTGGIGHQPCEDCLSGNLLLKSSEGRE